MRILGNSEKAQDVHQEVFLAIWKRWHKYNGQTNWNAYLYRAAVRKAIEFAKQSRAEQSIRRQSEYGSNPDTHIHTLWFDAVTMLPVKMEFDWLQDDGPRKRVLDQFEWDPELPPETFIPEIPADFTLEANSDG